MGRLIHLLHLLRSTDPMQCDAIVSHTEPPRASPTIGESDSTTVNGLELTPEYHITTSVQQTSESTIRPGNQVTDSATASDSEEELCQSEGE